jgi:hypothetical protein
LELDGEKNIGNTDRVIRAITGVLLLGTAQAIPVGGPWTAAMVGIALFLLLESATGY